MDIRGWSVKETHCLISLWSEGTIQEKLKDTYRNRSIYEEISRDMVNNGFERSWKQCQRKIKHLKSMYRKEKESNNNTGRDKLSWPFFDELHNVLGDQPAFYPAEGEVLDSELDGNEDEPLQYQTQEVKPAPEEDFLESKIIGGEFEPLQIKTEEDTEPVTTERVQITAETRTEDGRRDDITGQEIPSASSSQASPSASSRPCKRRLSFSRGSTRKKKSKFETALEAFTAALSNNSRDEELLLKMQREQHAHEEKLFRMLMQSITSLAHCRHCHANACTPESESPK
ncbi:myb/SANT-like DNA-binding domain-containing protein 2 [Cheilinus undulatus]|uniref:myb/SANT-like DNA-binding domain-containing protein 2 n=1 Tax=Cheilinus undulatus TaxID=241271 RepID=UPI001BD2ECB1|nr:myb/SANT-like DNA-binding domain-containing protein 2 [Cheilinus undulatus]